MRSSSSGSIAIRRHTVLVDCIGVHHASVIDDFDNETAVVVLDSCSIEQIQQLYWKPRVLDALEKASYGRVVEENAILVLEAAVVWMEVERQAGLAGIPLPDPLAPPVEVVRCHGRHCVGIY
jgi:hypothetical protein